MGTNSWSYGQYQQWVLHQRGGINPALYDITAMSPIISVSQNAPDFFNYVHEMVDNTGKPLFFIGTDKSRQGMIFNKNHQLIQTFTFGNNQPGEIAVVPTEDCHVYYMFNQTAPPNISFGSPYGETIEYLSRIEIDGNGDPHVSSTIELRRDWLYSSPGQTNWSSMSERYAISKEKEENGVKFRSVYTYNMTTDQSNFPQIKKTTPEIIEYRVNSGGLMDTNVNVLTHLEYDIPGSSQLNSGNCFQSEMELSQDGNWLAWVTRQGTTANFMVVNTLTQTQFSISKQCSNVNGLEFSPGSNRVYFSGKVNGVEGIFYWDFQTSPLLQSIPNTQDYSMSEIEFYNDGNQTGFILAKKGLSPQNNTIVKALSITHPNLNLNTLQPNQWQTQPKYTFSSIFSPTDILFPENIDSDLLNEPKLGTSCCRAKIHIDENADFLNPVILAGLSNSMFAPGEVTIEGNLSLPSNVVFRNCRIFFRPHASLTVPAGKFLQWNDCSAQACSETWSGIFVEGTFNVYNSGNTTLYEPVIRDALVAVTSKNKGILNFNGAIFDRNLLHIEITSFTGNYTTNIKNCQFRGSNVTALNNGNIHIPYPYYGPPVDGIFVHDAGELRLITNAQNQNIFSSVKNGIRAWRASVTCKEQRFISCQNGIQLQNAPNNSNIFLASLAFNTFLRCQNGIFANSHQSIIESNLFKDSKIGIYLLELQNNTTIRLLNKFQNNSYAAIQASNCKAAIEIIGNKVNNNNGASSAGFLISSSFGGPAPLLAQNNQITHVSAGIHVTGYTNPVINQNNIWLSGAKPSENNTKYVAGIFLMYCKSGNISSNTVKIVNKLDLSIGIGIDNTSNTTISNNTIQDTYHGIYLSSDLITQDFGTQITCNTMEQNNNGITYNWVSNLNGYSFGNHQNPTENRWLGNSFHIEQYNSDGVGCEFHTRATPFAGYDFVPSNFNLIGINPNPLITIPNSSFTSAPNCTYPSIPIHKKLSENPKPGIRMQSKMNLLAMLKNQPSLMQNDTGLTSFYNQYKQSSYDLLAQVDTLVAQNDWATARILNNSIVPDTAIGHTEMKWINEQWFIFKDGNAVDTSAIANLADFHVHLKGKAVIKARMLKNLLEISDTVQTVFYEVDGYPRALAKQPHSHLNTHTEVEETGIYPNPAHDMVFVKGKPLLIEFMDVLGKKVMETTATEISVLGMKKGLYVVLIHYENSVESIKLMID